MGSPSLAATTSTSLSVLSFYGRNQRVLNALEWLVFFSMLMVVDDDDDINSPYKLVPGIFDFLYSRERFL